MRCSTAPVATQESTRVRSRTVAVLRAALKAVLTGVAFYFLLSHEVRTESGERLSALRAILDYLPRIEAGTFWRFTLLAFSIKLCGIVASMLRWQLLLRGQGMMFPFFHVATTFLIGRFLGTFLPSTLGLDGYKLYDAARFTGRTAAVAAATVVEKVFGTVGILIAFLVTLPFGYRILGERAGRIVLGAIPAVVAVLGLLIFLAARGGRMGSLLARRKGLRSSRAGRSFQSVIDSIGAYAGRSGLLAGVAALSFIVHFATAAMYYFTALAVGAVHAEFWEVTFASTIQIVATVLSPFTIAGEGVREIVQALLLAHRIGMSQSIISAALGFWAAEAPTLSGAVFYLLRPPDYRPRFSVVEPSGMPSTV